MKYTSRAADAAEKWQRDLRARLLRLLKLVDLVTSRTRIALKPRVIRVESKDAYEEREIEIAFDRVYLARKIKEAGNNKEEAARRMGITPKTLRQKLRNCGLGGLVRPDEGGTP